MRGFDLFVGILLSEEQGISEAAWDQLRLIAATMPERDPIHYIIRSSTRAKGRYRLPQGFELPE